MTKLLHVLALAVIGAYMAPYLFFGQSAHVTIFDQLDSVLVDLQVLIASGSIFAPAESRIANLAGGIPRSSLPPALFAPVWLTYLFGTFAGFVVGSAVLRLVAYWGMYRLLTAHVLEPTDNRVPAVCASLTFALLPFYPLFGLSIAGQPLFVSALLNIRAGSSASWKDWLILLAFPFYSTLVYGGIFLLAIGAALWAVDAVVRRTPSLRVAGALFGTGAMYLVVEYQAVAAALGRHAYVSHRVEFDIAVFGFLSNLSRAWEIFRAGHEHAPSLHHPYVFATGLTAIVVPLLHRATRSVWGRPNRSSTAAVIAYVVLGATIYTFNLKLTAVGLAACVIGWGAILVWIGRSMSAPDDRDVRLLCWLVVASLSIAFWYAYWPSLSRAIRSLAPEFPYINLARVHFLHPTIWYVVFAIALTVLWRRLGKAGPAIVLVLAALQVEYDFRNSQNATERRAGNPSYREFFSTELFGEIADFLQADKREYRVVSIGMFPSVAAYNGFHTLDGYSASYPLEYKRRFRELIAAELGKSETYRDYFDKWGSRYYVFSHELERFGADAFLMTKSNVAKHKARIADLSFDVRAFRDLGGRYMFSAIAIENAGRIGLELVRIFEREGSPWRIYLYRIAPLDDRVATAKG